MFRRGIRFSPRTAATTTSSTILRPSTSSAAFHLSSTRLCSSSTSSTTTFNGITIPWEVPPHLINIHQQQQHSSGSSSSKNPVDHWAALGKEIIGIAKGCDAGPAAFEEVLIAREQLETMLDGATSGISGQQQLNVALFGGIVVNSLVELGGDVDFVAVGESEPNHTDAANAVIHIAKELRRLGLRSSAVPRARVPVVRTDRVSTALPGAPVHPIAHSAVFRYQRPATPVEQAALEAVLKEQYAATRVEWNGSSTLIANFPHTTETVRALSYTKSCGPLDIPLRLPVDPKHGSEIYRYTFDLCLHSSGLQNSYLFRNYLAASQFPYCRHLLLFVKRWARACGIINTHDGMLASYAVSVMVVHFLVRCGVVSPLQLADAKDPTALPKFPDYRPLEDGVTSSNNKNQGDSGAEVATLGFLAAHYLAYFASVFDYNSQVVCTTTKREIQKSVLRWGPPTVSSSAGGVNGATTKTAATATPNPTKPPFFSFCIKDPYNAENIGRNISPAATRKIQKLHEAALQMLARDVGRDAKFVAESLVDSSGPAMAGLKKRAANNAAMAAAASTTATGSKTTPGQQQQQQEQQQKQAAAVAPATAAEEEDELLSPQAEARRELSKMAFESRKEGLSKVGEATARSHEQTRAAQDLTRSIVDWIRAAEKKH